MEERGTEGGKKKRGEGDTRLLFKSPSIQKYTAMKKRKKKGNKIV